MAHKGWGKQKGGVARRSCTLGENGVGKQNGEREKGWRIVHIYTNKGPQIYILHDKYNFF